MGVFDNPQQLVLVANVAYSVALLIVGGLIGWAIARRIEFHHGFREGETSGRIKEREGRHE